MVYMEVQKLTVAEFRKQVKMALDFCVQGGMVEIDRMGQKFMITYVPRGMDIFVGSSEGSYKLGTNPHKVNHLEKNNSDAASLDATGVQFGDQPTVGKIATPVIKSPADAKASLRVETDVCAHGYPRMFCKKARPGKPCKA